MVNFRFRNSRRQTNGESICGLNIAGREGLNQLMADVENRRTDFSALLFFDVSRCGRFQDVDESAYYEYVLNGSTCAFGGPAQ